MKPHFRIFGIPVRVELFFFLLVGFLGWTSRQTAFGLAAWVVIVFVSILWHELGHAFAFRAFGFQPTIVLHGFGGATSSLTPGRLSPRRDILVSLAGPAAGMLLGGVVLAFSRYMKLNDVATSLNDIRLQSIIRDLLFVNIGWGVLNLLPMLPLDGGRVMAASLNLATKGKGETPALIISLLVGGALALLAFLTDNTYTVLLIAFLSLGNFTALQEKRKLAPQRENLQKLREGYEALDRRDLETASQNATAVLADPKSPEVKASATSLLMWTQMQQGRFQDAARLGEKAHEERPEPYLAYNIARAWARAGWPNESLNWLTKAIDQGYGDLAELDAEPDFASVRGAEFSRLRNGLPGAAPAAAEAPPESSPAADSNSQEAGVPAAKPADAAQPGIISKAILVVNGVIFLLQMLMPSLIFKYGQSPLDIARGEWYRLLTPMLLHADFLHIGFNSYALWIYGPTLEKVFGKFRFLMIYVIAGFTGAVASYTFGRCPSLGVGASGAIFGVIGALLIFNFNRRKISRAGAANLQGILMIIALNLVIGFAVPRIDNLAHIGGLVGGILVGAAFDFSQKLKADGRISLPLVVGAQATAAAVVTVAAAALAVYKTLNFTCGS